MREQVLYEYIDARWQREWRSKRDTDCVVEEGRKRNGEHDVCTIECVFFSFDFDMRTHFTIKTTYEHAAALFVYICECMRSPKADTSNSNSSSYKLTGNSHTSMAFALDVGCSTRVWCIQYIRKHKQHCTIVHDFVIKHTAQHTKSNVFILVLSSKTLNHASERACERADKKEWHDDCQEREKRRVKPKYTEIFFLIEGKEKRNTHNFVYVSSICECTGCLIKWNSIVYRMKTTTTSTKTFPIMQRDCRLNAIQWCS